MRPFWFLPDAPRSASASADGFGGTVTVTITMEKGKIVKAEASGPNETQGIGSRAVEILPGKMVEQNSVQVDALSGATMSSNGILQAAREAVEKISAQ